MWVLATRTNRIGNRLCYVPLRTPDYVEFRYIIIMYYTFRTIHHVILRITLVSNVDFDLLKFDILRAV